MSGSIVVIDLAWEHPDEDKHEEEDGNDKDQHEYALEEASHHMLGLVIDLADLCVRLLDVLCLRFAHAIYHNFILSELLFEAFCEVFHALHHRNHVFFKTHSLFGLFFFNFIEVDRATFRFLCLLSFSLLAFQFYKRI